METTPYLVVHKLPAACGMLAGSGVVRRRKKFFAVFDLSSREESEVI
jgi:hypothetical protein